MNIILMSMVTHRHQNNIDRQSIKSHLTKCHLVYCHFINGYFIVIRSIAISGLSGSNVFFCYEAAACCLLILPPSLANPRIHNSKKSFLVTKLFSPTPLWLSVSLSLTLSFSLSLSLSNFQPIFLILSRSHLILLHSLLPFMFFSISLLSNNNLFQPL